VGCASFILTLWQLPAAQMVHWVRCFYDLSTTVGKKCYQIIRLFIALFMNWASKLEPFQSKENNE